MKNTETKLILVWVGVLCILFTVLVLRWGCADNLAREHCTEHGGRVDESAPMWKCSGDKQ